MLRVISFLILAANALAAAPRIMTVCEIVRNLDQLDQAVVIAVGALRGTDEGAWLVEDCGLKVERAGREFNASISLVYFVDWFAAPPPLPAHFRWDKRELQAKLDEVKKTTKLTVLPQYHYRDRWYAIYGRLETKATYTIDLNGKRVQIAGYGHLSSSPAQLVAPAKGYRRLK